MEVEELSARLNSHEGLRRCRDKLWDVIDLGRVSVEDGGSLSCELLWAPTTVPVGSLKGALLERAEALVKSFDDVHLYACTPCLGNIIPSP
jgi:hypothetical protein